VGKGLFVNTLDDITIFPPEGSYLISAPKVTAVCPVVGRAKYLPMVLDCFLSQTFLDSELLIVEDGGHELESLIPQNERIRYVHIEGRRNTGAKRNLTNALAYGDILCHFDSDDFSCPERIEQQVKFLTENLKHMVVGYSDCFYFREQDKGTFKYQYKIRQPYATGTSLCYYKDYWAENRFNEKETGEDSDFVIKAQIQGVIASTESKGMVVAFAHADSVTKNKMGNANFFPVDYNTFPKIFVDKYIKSC
jgi:glycosyltransferase involved in cell wall biosynthesis